MPNLTDIYEDSSYSTVFYDPSTFSPRGVGNFTPKSSGGGQYSDVTDLFGDGNQSYRDRGGFNDSSGFGLGFRQPYVYTNLTDSNFQKNIKKYDNRAFPIGSTIQDAIRIGKFTASGKGLIWLAKQQLLHQQSPHDEANIVDPTSHLVSTVRPLSLGLIPRVTKHVSGGSAIGGILSLFGGTLGQPKSTVDPKTLPTADPKTHYGLIRGNNAISARERLTSYAPKTSLLSSFISSIFGQSFGAKQPDGIEPNKTDQLIHRADQDTYDLLITSPYNLETLTYPENIRSPLFKFHNSSTLNSISPDFKFNIYSPESVTKSSMNYHDSESIKFGAGGVGLFDNKSYGKFLDTLEEDDNSFILKFRRKWSEPTVLTSTKGNLGIKHTDHYNQLNRFWINSRFSGIQSNNFYGTSSVIEPARSLTNDGTEIPSDSNRFGTYEQKVDKESRLNKFFDSMLNGNLTNTTQKLKNSKHLHTLHKNPVHHDNETYIEKLNEKMGEGFNDNIGGASKPIFYNLNQLRSVVGDFNAYNKISKITGEEITDYTRYGMGIYNRHWKRGEDIGRMDTLNLQKVLDTKDVQKKESELRDLIKFSFHDVVNNRVAFFRSTIKSITDNVSPEWADIKYLGRADRVYVYNGLTRSISFNFRVYATSKREMKPMWQRINYLMGMAYPSKIEPKDKSFGINFPPYVKLTVGNLYQQQPILINSIGLTVPDEASWEIDNNMQLPMMVDISLTTTFLESVAPQTNISHFDKIDDSSYLLAGQ